MGDYIKGPDGKFRGSLPGGGKLKAAIKRNAAAKTAGKSHSQTAASDARAAKLASLRARIKASGAALKKDQAKLAAKGKGAASTKGALHAKIKELHAQRAAKAGSGTTKAPAPPKQTKAQKLKDALSKRQASKAAAETHAQTTVPKQRGAAQKKAGRQLSDKDFEAGKKSFDANVDKAGDFIISGPHSHALESYTSDYYKPINQQLRGQKHDFDEHEIAQKAQAIQSLLTDAALLGHTVKGGVYRGASLNRENFGELAEAHKAGKVVTFKGFTSTTVDLEVAKSFGAKNHPTDEYALFRMRTKSAVPVQRVSMSPHEKEALLPHNTKFRILAHKTETRETLWGPRTLHIFDLDEL